MTRRRTGSRPVWLQVLDGPLAGKQIMGDARTLPTKPGERFTVNERGTEVHEHLVEVHELEMVEHTTLSVRWVRLVERRPLPPHHSTPGPRLADRS